MAYYGVYRGVVVNTNDPQAVGRVMVTVPALGLELWALTAFPPTKGPSPVYQVSDAVIVAFEQGDSSRPVVLGRVGSS